ncbi:MAG: hypothetical protein RSF73_09190 [Ruthenibacterium sp.]
MANKKTVLLLAALAVVGIAAVALLQPKNNTGAIAASASANSALSASSSVAASSTAASASSAAPASSSVAKEPAAVEAEKNGIDKDGFPTGEGFTYDIIKSGPNKGQRVDCPPREVMDKWTQEECNAYCAKIDPEGYRRAAMTWEELVKEDSNYDELPPEEKLLIDKEIAAYNS